MARQPGTYCPACGHASVPCATDAAPADSESTSHQCLECGTHWTLRIASDSIKRRLRIDITGCDVNESAIGISEQPSPRTGAELPAPHFHSRLVLLTAREREVMDLIVAGETNTRTAQILNISVSAIEKHRASSMKKLRARSFVDVVRMYVASEASHPPGAEFRNGDISRR